MLDAPPATVEVSRSAWSSSKLSPRFLTSAQPCGSHQALAATNREEWGSTVTPGPELMQDLMRCPRGGSGFFSDSREKNPRKATLVQPTRSNGLQGRFYLAWRPPSRQDCLPRSAGYHSTTRPRKTCGVSLIAEEMPKVDKSGGPATFGVFRFHGEIFTRNSCRGGVRLAQSEGGEGERGSGRQDGAVWWKFLRGHKKGEILELKAAVAKVSSPPRSKSAPLSPRQVRPARPWRFPEWLFRAVYSSRVMHLSYFCNAAKERSSWRQLPTPVSNWCRDSRSSVKQLVLAESKAAARDDGEVGGIHDPRHRYCRPALPVAFPAVNATCPNTFLSLWQTLLKERKRERERGREMERVGASRH